MEGSRNYYITAKPILALNQDFKLPELAIGKKGQAYATVVIEGERMENQHDGTDLIFRKLRVEKFEPIIIESTRA